MGPSLGDYIFPDTGMYAPGTRYIFLSPWYTLPGICVRSIYQLLHWGATCAVCRSLDIDLGFDPLQGADILHTSAQETHCTWYPR